MSIVSPGAVDRHLASQNVSRTLSINAVQPVTLMCWISSALWSGGSRRSMVGTYNTATSGGTAIQIGTGTGSGEVTCWTWGGGTLVGSTGITVANDTWYHFAYTYDGTTNRLYINGALNNSTTNAQQVGTITAVYINGYPGGGTAETGAFSCDDISYFNRTLSADEILTAYSTRGDKGGLVYGLSANFLFNEATTGAIVANCIDYTGGLNDLTHIGAGAGNFTYATSDVNFDSRRPVG